MSNGRVALGHAWAVAEATAAGRAQPAAAPAAPSRRQAQVHVGTGAHAAGVGERQ